MLRGDAVATRHPSGDIPGRQAAAGAVTAGSQGANERCYGTCKVWGL